MIESKDNNNKVLKEINSSHILKSENEIKNQKENLVLSVTDNPHKKKIEEKTKRNKEAPKMIEGLKLFDINSNKINNYDNSKNFKNKPLINAKDKSHSLKKSSIKKNKNKDSSFIPSNKILNEIELNFKEEKNNSEFLEIRKKKKDYNKKNEKASIVKFVDEKNNEKIFPLYDDFGIGFGKDYKIKHLFQDNDVESDDESIKRGFRASLLNISFAIKLMKNKNEEYVGKYLKILRK